MASKDDFEKEKHQMLMIRITTGNWDALIVIHAGLGKIPVARTTQEEYIKGELRELTLAIEPQRKQHDSRIVKTLERAKKRLEGKLKEPQAADHQDGRSGEGEGETNLRRANACVSR